jgi:glycosyltransferase involved in cell wall biosynthesis
LIGEGHERKALQTHIDRCELQDHFILAGSVPPEDIATYYRLGDTFVFASKSETQGMVVLEAMAAGLPVVAVRSSGIDDAIRENHNGYKTPEKINQWRDAALRLMEDNTLHSEMSGNALAFAREHSIDHFAADVQGIYANVLAEFHKPGK